MFGVAFHCQTGMELYVGQTVLGMRNDFPLAPGVRRTEILSGPSTTKTVVILLMHLLI